MISDLTRDDIARVYAVIRPYIRRTPVLQHGGSFTARGAFANLLGRPVPSTRPPAASRLTRWRRGGSAN